jgi:hypothetical protein
MRGRSLSCAALVLAYLPLSTAGTDTPIKATAPRLTTKQIVDKNGAASGGSEAWRAVRTLEMKGKLHAGGNNRSSLSVPGTKKEAYVVPPRSTEQVEHPFVMDLERGCKKRVEIEFNGQTGIQVYDGTRVGSCGPF